MARRPGAIYFTVRNDTADWAPVAETDADAPLPVRPPLMVMAPIL